MELCPNWKLLIDYFSGVLNPKKLQDHGFDIYTVVDITAVEMVRVIEGRSVLIEVVDKERELALRSLLSEYHISEEFDTLYTVLYFLRDLDNNDELRSLQLQAKVDLKHVLSVYLKLVDAKSVKLKVMVNNSALGLEGSPYQNIIPKLEIEYRNAIIKNLESWMIYFEKNTAGGLGLHFCLTDNGNISIEQIRDTLSFLKIQKKPLQYSSGYSEFGDRLYWYLSQTNFSMKQKSSSFDRPRYTFIGRFFTEVVQKPWGKNVTSTDHDLGRDLVKRGQF